MLECLQPAHIGRIGVRRQPLFYCMCFFGRKHSIEIINNVSKSKGFIFLVPGAVAKASLHSNGADCVKKDTASAGISQIRPKSSVRRRLETTCTNRADAVPRHVKALRDSIIRKLLRIKMEARSAGGDSAYPMLASHRVIFPIHANRPIRRSWLCPAPTHCHKSLPHRLVRDRSAP